jgi:type I restriction enzyme, S subunit
MREDWIECTFEDLLDYVQPTNYIVKSTKYSDDYKTPVLTAGKSFIKGYTNETTGIFNDLPTIIFDDFTTATKFVDFEFKVKSSAMKILVPTSKLVNMKFVFNCIQVNQVRNDTHKRYWISVYAKKKILLPPLVEQNAILAKTEELFSDLDNGIANFKKAQEQLKIYRQAVLKKAFEGELTKEWRALRQAQGTPLPTAEELLKQIKEERQNHYNQQVEDWKKAVKKWEETGKVGKKPSKPQTLKELPPLKVDLNKLPAQWNNLRIEYLLSLTKKGMTTGPFGTMLKKSEHKGNGIPVLGIENIGEGVFKMPNKIFVSSEKAKELTSFKVDFGDIIISRSGTVGEICALDKHIGLALISTNLIRVSLNNNLINSKYFVYLFQGGGVREQVRKLCTGSTRDFLNQTILTSLYFPICSLEEQTQIVAEIESRLSVCDKMEQSINESLEKAEALRQSILKKAFEGRLLSEAEVTACKQAADYEPASELLTRIERSRNEKIKAEKLAKEQDLRQAQGNKKKKSTTKKKSEK